MIIRIGGGDICECWGVGGESLGVGISAGSVEGGVEGTLGKRCWGLVSISRCECALMGRISSGKCRVCIDRGWSAPERARCTAIGAWAMICAVGHDMCECALIGAGGEPWYIRMCDGFRSAMVCMDLQQVVGHGMYGYAAIDVVSPGNH